MTRPGNHQSVGADAHNDPAAMSYRIAQSWHGSVLALGDAATSTAHALSLEADMKVTCLVTTLDVATIDEARDLEALVADPEASGWHTALGGRTYDAVVVGDLLEHVRDPARLLRDLREQRVLAEDGHLLLSFVNVAHRDVVNELLSGESPRIRWYTEASMTRLLGAAGYLVTETHRIRRPEDTEPSVIDDARTYTFVLHAQPSTAGPQLAMLHRQLHEARERIAELETIRDEVNALLEEERATFRNEIGRGAQEIEQLQKRLDQMMRERSLLREEVDRLHHELAQLGDELDNLSHVQESTVRLRDELSAVREDHNTAVQRLESMEQSRSYRLGRRLISAADAALAPRRWFRRGTRSDR